MKQQSAIKGAGGATGKPADLAICADALARLMPMHVVLSVGDGRIRAVGPTVRRLFPGQRLIGRAFLSLFDLRAPLQARGDQRREIGVLPGQVGGKLRLQPRVGPGQGLRMRAEAVQIPPEGLLLVNLSFGVDVVRAVGLLHLTIGDFAATDLAVELLSVAEANTTVMTEMRAMSERLVGARVQAQEEAMTDPLTGLRNRRACDSFLSRQCRDGGAFGLLHLDLDYFKQVNDRLGHAAGDHVLLKVAEELRRVARGKDCIARVGGDEFVFILPGLIDSPRLTSLAEQIIEGVCRPIHWQGEVARISASIGLVRVDAGLRPDPAQVLANADIALYAAKDAGRGRVVHAEDMGLTVSPSGPFRSDAGRRDDRVTPAALNAAG